MATLKILLVLETSVRGLAQRLAVACGATADPHHPPTLHNQAMICSEVTWPTWRSHTWPKAMPPL